MPYCVVNGCTSNSTLQRNVHWFTFPKDQARFKVWLHYCNRQDFAPSKHSRICGKHFTPRQYSKDPAKLAKYGYVVAKIILKGDAVPDIPISEMKRHRKNTNHGKRRKGEETSLKQDSTITEVNSAPNDTEEGQNTVNGEFNNTDGINGCESTELTSSTVGNDETVAMDTGATTIEELGGEVGEFGVEDDDVLDLLEKDDVQKNDQTDGDDMVSKGDNPGSDMAIDALQITSVVSEQILGGTEKGKGESEENEQLPGDSETISEEPDKKGVVGENDDVQDQGDEQQLVPGGNDEQEPVVEQDDDDVLDLNEESDQAQTDKEEIFVPEDSSEKAVDSSIEHVEDGNHGSSHVTQDDNQCSSDIQLSNPEITDEPKKMTEDLEMSEMNDLTGENKDEGMEITEEMEDSLLNKEGEPETQGETTANMEEDSNAGDIILSKDMDGEPEKQEETTVNMDGEPETQGETTVNMEEDSNAGEVTTESVEMGQDNEVLRDTTSQNVGQTSVSLDDVVVEDIDMVKDDVLASNENDDKVVNKLDENDVSMEVAEEKAEMKEGDENNEQKNEEENEGEINNQNETETSPVVLDNSDGDTENAKSVTEEVVTNEETQVVKENDTPVVENEENENKNVEEKEGKTDEDKVINEEFKEKSSEDNIEKSSEDNIEKRSEDNIEKRSEDNIEKSSEDNIEKRSEDNIEKRSEDNIEKSSEDNIEKRSEDNIEKSSKDNIEESKSMEKLEEAAQVKEQEIKSDQKSQETVASDVSIMKASTKTEDDDIQIIDLDADDSDTETSKDIKQEKTEKVKEEGGLRIQISSVSGATDIPAAVKKESSSNKTEIKDVKKETKPGVPVKQEVKQEVKSDNKVSPKSKIQTCIVCKKTGKCKYNIVRNGDIKHLCDDDCFKRFRSNPTTFLRTTPPTIPTEENKTITPVNNQQGQYKTCQVCQIMNVNASSSKPFLNWQGMDFCGEDCLGKFQSSLNTSCSICSNVIQQAVKGKFCVKFANNMRQLCSQGCYNEFTKRQKLCECCQKDISKSSDAFVAPAGTDGSFKDFCSQKCLQKYEEKNNRDIEITGVEQTKVSGTAPKGTHTCSVCSKVSTMKHQIQLEGKANYLCGDPCFSAFQYANKLTMNTCDNCGIYCYNEGMNPQYIQFEGQQKRFCSFMCVNTFKTLNKKVVSCSWCNCKKSNFDMIERVDANNKYQLFCSLNCLSLYRVNLQATSNQAVMCDQCKRYVPAQYHLTMSDASVRNFCSYNCVMNFQSQFTGTGTPQNNAVQKSGGIQTRSTNRPPQPQPPPQPKPVPQAPVKTATGQQNMPRPPAQVRPPTNPNMNSIPIISNVVSLAPQGNQQQQVNFKSNQQVPLVITNKNSSIRTTVPAQSTQIQQTVIIQPPQPKVFKNKSCLCKPFVQTKATSCRPHTQTKETQTDKDKEPHGALIPIPIPFYVPVPVAMYSQPLPTPFPFPIPIPIPCFIPTTKKSTNSILKHIKEIREKIPDDPLEAELLMMAEAVSAVTKDSSGSESEDDAEMATVEETTVEKINPPSCSASPEPEVPEKSAELGEDMLQMALRMATEMTSEPVMDLEETIEPVPVNAEPPPPKPKVEEDEEEEDNEDDEEYTPVRETRSKGKGTKRTGVSHPKRKSKRQKAPVMVKIADSPTPEESEPVVEPPLDANLYLKYTYGVNAWKHWVVQKNNQLDKVSKQGSGKLKLFKTDMLQCSADELNYSLCLFVKEVRKPNGEEYAADSIYYLCLGIQMFLFENERIDNIFTDIYYEKFTECLNEVLLRYTPKLNAAGQIVCRIEEEHLWECKQLGAHSPHVLLNTLVYFNTKFFQLKTPEDHLKLSFTHIMKHWKKSAPGKGNAQGRSVYLRYYCPTPVRPATADGNRKKKEELPVYEQAENLDNPLRCPVKLYEFYLSKCPESIKNRSDAFYLVPERSCVPDSPVWYSTQNLQIEAMNKMLHRTMLVREIQESFIHTQPVYA